MSIDYVVFLKYEESFVDDVGELESFFVVFKAESRFSLQVEVILGNVFLKHVEPIDFFIIGLESRLYQFLNR